MDRIHSQYKISSKKFFFFAIGVDGKYQGKDVLIIEFILSPERIFQQIYPYTIEDKKVLFRELI